MVQNDPDYTVPPVFLHSDPISDSVEYIPRMISILSFALVKSLLLRDFFMVCILNMLQYEQSSCILRWQLAILCVCQHKIGGVQ